jgi:hypothetical protein
LILIFSRIGEVEATTGSTSFVETDSLFAMTFRRWALTFSLAVAILFKGKSNQGQSRRREQTGVDPPVLPEYALSPLLDLGYTLHSLDCGLDQVAVVAHWHVSSLFEVDGRVLLRQKSL